MPKRLGTYYIVNAARFAQAVMPGIAAATNLKDAHNANQEAPGETLVVYVPQGAVSKTEKVQVEKTMRGDWKP